MKPWRKGGIGHSREGYLKMIYSSWECELKEHERMKPMKKQTKRVRMCLAAAIMLMGPISFAQQNIVGFNKINVPANTDVRLSVPFTTAPYGGSGSQDAAAVFTVIGTTSGSTINVTSGALTSGVFTAANVTKSSYYVRFMTGNAKGLWMTIKSNDVGGFVLDDTYTLQRAALINKVQSGDQFRVYKHQTISGVFSSDLLGISYVNGTTILLYENDIDTVATNPTSWKQAAYTTSGGGKWSGSGIDGTTILRPEAQFILRNTSLQTLFVAMNGLAPDYPVSMLIKAGDDMLIGTGYPVPITLKDSGLGGVTGRIVMTYDNQATGQNKTSLKQAAYTTSGGGKWTGSGVTGNEVLSPSEAIRFRLPSGDAGTIVTINKPY
jgi:uncharacterized protein (TIGR02597 family)